MNSFIEVSPSELRDNIWQLIGREQFLLTAGQPGDYNTMTCAWGGAGIAWNAPVATVFVRHSRHTYAFTERETHFSMSFFGDGYRSALQFCGSHSGRDVDKAAQTGLTPVFDASAPYFGEARLVLVCRKLYAHDVDVSLFLDPAAASGYAADALHRVYTGEIVKALLDKNKR